VKRRPDSQLRTDAQVVYGKDGGEDRYLPASGRLEYEAPLVEHDPRWVVTLVLDVVNGRLVVTELRLRARGDGPFGSGPPVVPEGGITTPVLRKIPVARLVEEARVKAQASATGWAAPAPTRKKKTKGAKRDPLDELLDSQARALARAGRAETGRAGRPRTRDDEHYLVWAVAYARKLAEGSHAPVAEIARERGVDRGMVRDRLHVARSRGLLTEVPEGARIGGELTDKARELLARMKEA
jgi:hypothetical protein